MSNKEIKAKIIKAAFQSCGIVLGDSIPNPDNGWSEFISVEFPDKCDIIDENYRDIIRPKELKRIINNNGWTRIEPDRSNLPTEMGNYKFIVFGTGYEHIVHWVPGQVSVSKVYTHYRRLLEETKPIY